MSEVFKEDQDFFNLLIEETYQGEKLVSHLGCYSTPVNLSQQLLRDQISYFHGQHQKNLKCFRFKTSAGLIDFPQNWGPFTRVLFYFDNNEKNFFGIYDKSNDPFAFCHLFNFDKVILFSQGNFLCLAGFKTTDLKAFEHFVSLLGPREIKIAA